MIREPKRRRGSNFIFYAASFLLAAGFVAAIAYTVFFVVEVVRSPFADVTPNVPLETLNREILGRLNP